MGRAWEAVLLAVIVASPVLAGCIGTDSPLEQQTTDTDPQDLVDRLLRLREDRGFEVDTPVQVVLVGFDPGMGTALEQALEPEEVLHAALSYTRDFPPGSGQAVDPEDLVVPVTPEANHTVQQVDEAFAQAFFSHVADHTVEGAEDVYDANAAEDELARMLPAAGIELDTDTPTFVILHAQDRLDGQHAWRFSYPNGHLEPVRAFGERTPMLVYDVSAEEDPYVVGPQGDADVADYNLQVDPSGDQAVAALEELVIDATHYRLAKGSIYPVSTDPCHKVTFVLAVHRSAISDLAPGAPGPEAWVDVPAQEAAFENATGDEVTVELKTIVLPQDDPVLDATTRRAAGTAGSNVFLDTMRWYLDQNWETYVDVAEGCENYLSLLLFADATSELGRGFSGIGMYDVNTDRRITFSVVTDVYRLENAYDGPGDDQLGYEDDREPDYVNRLFSHETGHILGLHHPQHLSRADGEPSPVNHAFESVWSSMSYQVSDRTIDFGEIDTAQFQRNRAGYIVQQAQLLDLEDTAAYQDALEAAAQHDWVGVQMALEDPVAQAASDDGGDQTGLPGYHVTDHHWHPGPS